MRYDVEDPTRPTSADHPPHDPQVYVSETVFERERTALFDRQWIFAGLANEMAAHNDFVRVPLLAHDVVIQNFHGELRAFINSCSHRHSIIHEAPCGNRPLICPYHGWAYDKRGAPVGIPCRTEFPQVVADPMSYRLQPVELELAGSFMFVRLPSNRLGMAGNVHPFDRAPRPGLREFLGDAFDFMTCISDALDIRLDESIETVDANWKILIENSLEGYHVPYVHSNSLGAIVQLSPEPDDVQDFYPATGHSYMHNAANAKWLRRWTNYAVDVGTWPMTLPYYVHRLVFPILTITSFLGYSFHIQRFHPDSAHKTTIHSRIYASRFAGQTERGTRIIDAIFRENVHFTHKVFEEDRLASERAHVGSRQANRPSVLARNVEARLAHFRTAYHRSLG